MFEIKTLTLRNIKVFLRDKTAVFFSFLSMIIILALYLLFLGRLYSENLEGISENLKTFLSTSQMMGGILVINTVSLSLGMMGNIVGDIENHLLEGFLVTPVKRYKIIISYYLSALIVTIVLNLIILLATFLYVGIASGYWYSLMTLIWALGLLVLLTFISSSIMILVTSFLNSVNAFGAVAGVLGTFVGFLSGIYIPLANFGKEMNYVASLSPFTHFTIKLKNILLRRPFELLEKELGDNATPFLNEIKIYYGTNEIGLIGMNVSFEVIFILFLALSSLMLFFAYKKMESRIKNV